MLLPFVIGLAAIASLMCWHMNERKKSKVDPQGVIAVQQTSVGVQAGKVAYRGDHADLAYVHQAQHGHRMHLFSPCSLNPHVEMQAWRVCLRCRRDAAAQGDQHTGQLRRRAQRGGTAQSAVDSDEASHAAFDR